MTDSLRSEISRQANLFETMVEQKNEVMMAHRAACATDEWNDCYYCHPYPHQVASAVKSAVRLRNVDPALADLIQPIINHMVEIAARHAELKEAAAKAKAEKVLVKNEKAAAKEEAKKNPYANLHPELASLLRGIANGWHKHIYAQVVTEQNNFVEEIGRSASVAGSYDPRLMFPDIMKEDPNARHPMLFKAKFAVQARQKRAAAYDYVFEQCTGWCFRHTVKNLIDYKARRHADAVVGQFVSKLGSKMQEFIARKGYLFTAFVTGNIKDHWITFNFSDGSTFQVQSQIVYVCNSHRTQFVRFPMCFRNVMLKDGSRISHPSEAKMKKLFV